MTKNLFIALLFVAQTAFAQIISKDPNFATNGIYDVGNGANYSWTMAQDSAGKIYSSYSTPNTNESFVLRLTTIGTLDPTFGNNGIVQLPYYSLQNKLKMQSDGKLVIFGYHSDGQITRLLPNGQLDTTFGTNGTATISGITGSDSDARSIGLILQNEKIIVHGMNSYTQHRIYRLHANGNIDNTFGSNGYLSTQGAFPLGTIVLTDNQNNIICITKTSSNNNGNGIIEKYTPDGQPIASFGNNGVLQLAFSLGYIGSAMIDSNNKIVYSNGNFEMFRINPDGTLDNTFNYNLPAYSGINGGAWIQSIIEKDGYYYIGGNGEGDFAATYFISKLNQNGSVNSSFGYYSETSSLSSIEEMTINSNNIIVNGSGYIVKYLLSSGTLSTIDTKKEDQSIYFENPVQQKLVYQSKDKVSKIVIYSPDGRIIKTIKNSGLPVSDLPKGIYIAKVTFENGSITTKKFIKN